MDNINSSATAPVSAPSNNFRTIKLSIIVILLMFFSGVIGYFIGSMHTSKSLEQQKKTSTNTQPVNQAKKESVSGCLKQGIQPKDDYLPPYTVKSGDSLLSIAKSQLKDGSRVSELIILNSDRYPELSLSKPFLEQGWKIYLPPQNLEATNGYIFMISGNVEIYPSPVGFWGVKYNGGRGGLFPVETLSKDNIKAGDCVSVLYQGGGETKLFSVKRQ